MKMNRFILIPLLLVTTGRVLWAQSFPQLLKAVLQKQATLKSLSYTVERTDTLVTGDIRQLTGRAQLQVDTMDGLFGFRFWANRDGLASQVLYNGQVGYVSDDANRTYTRLTGPEPIRSLVYQPAGQLILPDLIRLDTAKATRFSVRQDSGYYFITMHYADLDEYDVRHRYKEVGIDRVTFLTRRVRHHQQTLGKVQDLCYQVTYQAINDPTALDSLRQPAFLKTHQLKLQSAALNPPLDGLKGKPAPAFALSTLDNRVVSSSDFRGQVTLLDFWEVWCGPCIESMPKVARLYDQYGPKGLHVYGITHEKRQLEVARKLVKQRGLRFPTLIGTDQVRKEYQLQAIPRYVVIDRAGKVAYVSEGYSAELEATIRQLLEE